jgi:hypothetical protein
MDAVYLVGFGYWLVSIIPDFETEKERWLYAVKTFRSEKGEYTIYMFREEAGTRENSFSQTSSD